MTTRPITVTLPGKPFSHLHEYADAMVCGFGSEAEEEAFHNAMDNAQIAKCGKGKRVTLRLTRDEARAMLSEAETEAETDLMDFGDDRQESAHRNGLRECAKRLREGLRHKPA